MSRRNSLTRNVVFAGLVVGALLLTGGLIAGNLFNVESPFQAETKDRTPPLILNEIRDLAEFRAGEAEFEVIIDRETDIKWMPAFVAGERVQFVAVGSVDATVDFSAMSDDAVIFDAESNSATLILPPPVIGEAALDFQHSGVMNRDRGVLDRLSGVFEDNPTTEISLIQEAEMKMEAAVAGTDLLEQAESNTTEMLTSLIESLGVENVRVVYEQQSTSAA